MQLTDRQDFDRQIAVLCAAFNVPCTAERQEAYWRGLAKMPMSSVIRCIDFVLAEDYAEKKIPTVGALWDVYRNLRTIRSNREELPSKTGLTREQHLTHLHHLAIEVAKREKMPMFKGKIMWWQYVPEYAREESRQKWEAWEKEVGDKPDSFYETRAQALMKQWGESRPDELNVLGRVA